MRHRPCFHPYSWILLTEPPSEAMPTHRKLLNVTTRKVIMVDMPELNGHAVLPGPNAASEGMIVVCERTLVMCILNLFTRHVVDLPALQPSRHRGPISNVFHEDHEVMVVDFVVDLLEVNVSPTHLLLCGKWFTHTTTLWLFVPLVAGSRVFLPTTTASEGRGQRLVPHGHLAVLAGCLRCLARPPAKNLLLVLEGVDALLPKRRAHSSSCSTTPLLVGWSHPPLGKPRQGITQPTRGALAHS
jgi:hypothetical protein